MTPPYALSFFRAVTIPSGTQWCNDTHRLAHALSAATRRLRIVILQSGNDTERIKEVTTMYQPLTQRLAALRPSP